LSAGVGSHAPRQGFTGAHFCQTSVIARIDRSFTIDKPAELAQAMFVRDIAPELARDRDFQIAHERPGHLVFSDGIATAGDEQSVLGEGTHEEERWTAIPSLRSRWPGRFVPSVDRGGEELAAVLPRHIKVDFTPEGVGTRVHVHGHVEHDICHGLELLGTPRHWPEIADQPHD
jgi:hypothetical protein